MSSRLLFKSSADGFGREAFLKKCQHQHQILILFNAKETGNIFGVFLSNTLDGTEDWRSDSNAFLFNVTKKEQFKIKSE